MSTRKKIVSFRPQTAQASRSSSASNIKFSPHFNERQMNQESYLIQNEQFNNKDMIDSQSKLLSINQQTRNEAISLNKENNKSQEMKTLSRIEPQQQQSITYEQNNILLSDFPQFKILQPLPEKSQYQVEYIRRKSTNQIKAVNHWKNQEFKSQQKMDLKTVYQDELIDHSKSKSFELKKQQRPITAQQQPFAAITTYQATYFNKDGQKVSIIPQNHTNVMKELEFLGRTVYKDNFTGETMQKEPFINFGARSSFKNPLTAELPIFTQTSSQMAFKPFKLKNEKKIKKTQEVITIPSFYGQFRTHYKDNFIDSGQTLSISKKTLTDRKTCQEAPKRILPIF